MSSLSNSKELFKIKCRTTEIYPDNDGWILEPLLLKGRTRLANFLQQPEERTPYFLFILLNAVRSEIDSDRFYEIYSEPQQKSETPKIS